jgi:hypothetical protein
MMAARECANSSGMEWEMIFSIFVDDTFFLFPLHMQTHYCIALLLLNEPKAKVVL